MLPLVLAVTAAAATAVQPAGPPSSVDLDVQPKRRNGIVLGLTLGAGLGGASGYPNDSQDIGDPTFHSSSGWMPGASETVLVMGAHTDYLNFGFWFGSSAFRSDDRRATAFGIGLRVEAFPLLTLFPRLDGLALFSEFGLGSGKLTIPNRPDASGTQSVIGVGTFYEWSLAHFLGGHLGIGPSLEYDQVWSQPFEDHGFVLSARVVFYGGP